MTLTADTTAADLLAYVVTHPEETDCRLVYADWLSDHGEDARAEFIRVGCELAGHPQQVEWLSQMPVEQWSGSREEGALLRRLEALRRRERELLHSEAFDLWTLVPWVPKDWTMTLHARKPKFRVGAREGVDDIWCSLRRGFVEQVTLTAAALAGGPCGRCEGLGVGEGSPAAVRHRHWPDCPDCRGTGHTPGHAAALFQAAPILSVTLSDRAPARERHGVHCWTDGGRFWRDDSPDVLPGDLFRLLPAAEGGWVWGTTAGERDATDDLSVAALLYGRRAAWPCQRCWAKEIVGMSKSAGQWLDHLCPACAGSGHAVTVTPAPAATP